MRIPSAVNQNLMCPQTKKEKKKKEEEEEEEIHRKRRDQPSETTFKCLQDESHREVSSVPDVKRSSFFFHITFNREIQ